MESLIPGRFLSLAQSQKLSVVQGSGESGCFPEASPHPHSLESKREMNLIILVPSPKVMAASGRRLPVLSLGE